MWDNNEIVEYRGVRVVRPSFHYSNIPAFREVAFEPVKTDALKIEITLQEKWSAGVQEVVIE